MGPWHSNDEIVPPPPVLMEEPPETRPGPPRRRRRIRRLLLIGLVVQVVVLIVADRVAAHVAASQMVSQVQKSQHLPNKPEASVGGVPFLTQVMVGKYKDIGFGIHRIAVSNMCVDDINLHLKGVHVPVRAMISNHVRKVPIDRVVGTVHLTFPDLNAYLAQQPGHVTVAAVGEAIRVSAPINVPVVGQVTVSGDARASVQNNRLKIAPTGIGIKGLGTLSVPRSAVTTVTVPLPGLPVNLRLVSAKATSAGIVMTAEADHVTLDTTKTAPPIRAC
ncbi:MAG: LmeA family phospholipid-binding protein [Frankia sp.]